MFSCPISPDLMEEGDARIIRDLITSVYSWKSELARASRMTPINVLDMKYPY